MAHSLETANAASGESGSSNPTLTPSHSLQNASGSDRIVVLFVASMSGQVGDLTVSSVTYNSTAPDYTVTLNQSGGGAREVWYAAIWEDASLPSTSGSYTCSFTMGNHGANPSTQYYIIEASGVDQTTVPAETHVTNTGFGTTGQTYTPSAGDFILAMISNSSGTNGTDQTASWGSDTELADIPASSTTYQGNLSVGYATDGSITGTLDSSADKQGWIGLSFSDASAGTTDGAADVNSSGAVTMAGNSQVDVPVDINASAVLTGEGASQSETDVSISASASVTAEGESSAAADFSSVAQGAVSWVGESTAVTNAALSIDATATVTSEGDSQTDVPASIDASASITMEGQAQTDSDTSISGTAQVSWVGESVSGTDADISINATSSLSMEGTAQASADYSVDSNGQLDWLGNAQADSDIDMSAASDATFSSEAAAVVTPEVTPEVERGLGGGSWKLYADKRKKLKAKQEKQLMQIITMAMPYLIQPIYVRNNTH